MIALENKVVWITGGSSGIGKAAAIGFARAGCRVAVSARSIDTLRFAAEEIAKKTGNRHIAAIECDVSKWEQVEQALAHIADRFGDMDILVNNAGIGRFAPVLETSEQDWDELMDVNVKGAFLCSKAVLPSMIKRKSGHIVNVASVAAIKAFTNCGGYCASKAALLQFTRVLRLETMEHNIRVTAVIPGATETAIWGSANVEYERMMKPEDIAEVIVSACSADPRAVVEEIVLRPAGGDL